MSFHPRLAVLVLAAIAVVAGLFYVVHAMPPSSSGTEAPSPASEGRTNPISSPTLPADTSIEVQPVQQPAPANPSTAEQSASIDGQPDQDEPVEASSSAAQSQLVADLSNVTPQFVDDTEEDDNPTPLPANLEKIKNDLRSILDEQPTFDLQQGAGSAQPFH
jgi:hypothetical protein